jgi:hypothetical protein
MPLYRFSVADGLSCVGDACVYLDDATSARECAAHVARRLERESSRPTGGWSVLVTDDDGDEVLTVPVGGSAAVH